MNAWEFHWLLVPRLKSLAEALARRAWTYVDAVSRPRRWAVSR